MNAAGIDVSSRKSMVAILRPFGEVVKLPFEVCHSAEDLSALAQQLKSIEGETRVVMEHTGRYYESIAKVLHVYVSVVNPLLIKEYGANSLRRVKTDKADAMKIARYALDNWADLRDYTPMDTIRYNLKTLNRQFQLASKQRTASSNNLIALLEQSFPGVRKCFDSPVRSDGTQKWVDFAHAFFHVDCVRKQSLNAFSERYRKWCKRHGYFFKQANAEEVYTLAKNAVMLAPKSDVTKVLIQEAANQLTSISRSVETYRTETGQKWSALRPCCRSIRWSCKCTALASLLDRNSWPRLEMCAGLNANRLWLPLPVSILCPTSPVRRIYAATNPRNEALRTFVKPCSIS